MRRLLRLIPVVVAALCLAAQEWATHWVKEHRTPLVQGLVSAAGGIMAAVVLRMLLFPSTGRAVWARIVGGYPCEGMGLFIPAMTAFMGGVFAWGVFGVATALRLVPASWDGNAGWLTAFLVGLTLGWPAVLRERAIRREHRRELGLCPGCGYDLRATPRCPECGESSERGRLLTPAGSDGTSSLEVNR